MGFIPPPRGSVIACRVDMADEQALREAQDAELRLLRERLAASEEQLAAARLTGGGPDVLEGDGGAEEENRTVEGEVQALLESLRQTARKRPASSEGVPDAKRFKGVSERIGDASNLPSCNTATDESIVLCAKLLCARIDALERGPDSQQERCVHDTLAILGKVVKAIGDPEGGAQGGLFVAMCHIEPLLRRLNDPSSDERTFWSASGSYMAEGKINAELWRKASKSENLSGVSVTKGIFSKPESSKGSPSTPRGKGDRRRCYKCDSSDHIASDCKKRGRYWCVCET